VRPRLLKVEAAL